MRRQKGVTLIDLIFSLALSMLLLAGLAVLAVQLSQGNKALRHAEHLLAGREALKALLEEQGASIVTSGSAVGISNVWFPSDTDLKAAGYLDTNVAKSLELGGNLTFEIRKEANNDLVGLACGDQTILHRGKVSPVIAAMIEYYLQGTGVRTSIANPNILNGAGHSNLASTVSGGAIVCAIASVPNPT